jgi:hypothetical protein
MNDLSPISLDTINVNDWTVPEMKLYHDLEITYNSCVELVEFVELVELVLLVTLEVLFKYRSYWH